MKGYGVQQIAHPFVGRVILCSNCGKEYSSKSYEEPPNWFKMGVIGPRHKPFKEWYACSQSCVNIILVEVREFLLQNLEE